jgi:nucleotide-binding universal stress UspA family protein
MTESGRMDRQGPARPGPVLLCFDGSDDARSAIEKAGQLLGPCEAIVLTVCEPVETWEPYDPSPLSAAFAKVAYGPLGLDEIATDLARETMEHGVERARAAGFEADGSVVHGKAWRAICDAADELDASVIVLGARGLSRVQSALLGSVSAAVAAHAQRPLLVVPWVHA